MSLMLTGSSFFRHRVSINILAVELLKCTDQASIMGYFLPLLSCKVSGADNAHIFSSLLRSRQLAWCLFTGALCVPWFLALAKSSILSCQSLEHTILVTNSNSPSETNSKRKKFETSEPVLLDL